MHRLKFVPIALATAFRLDWIGIRLDAQGDGAEEEPGCGWVNGGMLTTIPKAGTFMGRTIVPTSSCHASTVVVTCTDRMVAAVSFSL